MKIKLFITLIISCLFVLSGKSQKKADSVQIDLIIKQFEKLGDNPKKMAEYISEFEHEYLERYSQQLFPYIKKEYDDLEKNKSLPLELKFEVIYLLKTNYYIMGYFDKAAKLSYEMLNIATEVNDSLLLYYSYSSVADIEVEMGNEESALDFLLLAKKYATIHKEAHAQTYIDLGRLYLYMPEFELAKENILRGTELAKESEDYFQLAYGYSVLMDYYTLTEELDTALKYYSKVDSVIKSSHFLETSGLLVNVSIRAANIYKTKGEYEKSGEYFEQVYRIAQEANDRYTLSVIYDDWSDLEALKGNYSKSLDLFKQHATLQDSIFNETSINQINTLKTTYEVEKKDLEIQASKEKEKYARHQFWLVLICGLIFVTALIILAFFLQSKLKAARLKQKLITEKNRTAKIEVESLEREVQLKNNELADLFLHQYEKATLLNDVIETVDASSGKLKKALHEQQDKKQDWINFKAHFDQVHEGFFDKLNELSPDLTPKDIRFCAYIRMNLTSKEIAIMLGISHRTVQGIRSRVRKKLKLDSKGDIVKFLMDL